MSPILRKLIKICVPIAVYILIWQLLSMYVGSSLLLPSPKETLDATIGIVSSLKGWQTILSTMLRISVGFSLGFAFGIMLAVLTAKFHVCSLLLNPLRSLIKTTPITSFALILLVSVVSNIVPVVVAMIVVIPMVWRTTEEAIVGLDVMLSEMGDVYLTKWKKMIHVTLPQILPQVFATASTALGFAWKAVITAEILALPVFGIGRQMQSDKTYLDIPGLFAWTILVIILSVAFESLLKLVLGKAGKRYD
jgi:NitT/TauT family transport system permease protein